MKKYPAHQMSEVFLVDLLSRNLIAKTRTERGDSDAS